MKKTKAQAQTDEPQTQAPGAGQSGLPLFYRKPAVLQLERHGEASVSPTEEYAFARNTNALPVNAIEFIEAAKYYPIVFTPGEVPHPAVVLGLEQANYFIDAEGQWEQEYYIPAYVRQYPFILFQRDDEDRLFLCIDEASPNFHTGKVEGAQPIYENGQASGLAKQALEFCSGYYRHHAITRSFMKDLNDHKLFMPYQSQATLADSRVINLGGFLMIDENAFNALSDEVILEFRKKGWLPFIYLALASAGNWNRLVNRAAKKA